MGTRFVGNIRTVTEDGKIFAVLPIEDYEELVARAGEDSDEVAYDLAKARNEESFPIGLFDRIDNGESPLKVFREYRNIDIEDLAKCAEISQTFLSQLEKKVKRGSSKTMKKLSSLLKVPVELLVEKEG